MFRPRTSIVWTEPNSVDYKISLYIMTSLKIADKVEKWVRHIVTIAEVGERGSIWNPPSFPSTLWIKHSQHLCKDIPVINIHTFLTDLLFTRSWSCLILHIPILFCWSSFPVQQLSFLVCCICRIEFICTDSNLILSPSSRAEKDQISYLQIPILSRPLLPGQPAQVLAQSRPHSIHFLIHPYSCPPPSNISLTHYHDDDDFFFVSDDDDDNLKISFLFQIMTTCPMGMWDALKA